MNTISGVMSLGFVSGLVTILWSKNLSLHCISLGASFCACIVTTTRKGITIHQQMAFSLTAERQDKIFLGFKQSKYTSKRDKWKGYTIFKVLLDTKKTKQYHSSYYPFPYKKQKCLSIYNPQSWDSIIFINQNYRTHWFFLPTTILPNSRTQCQLLTTNFLWAISSAMSFQI